MILAFNRAHADGPALSYCRVADWGKSHAVRKTKTTNICRAERRETAEDRALGRYLRNRAKELGALLPPRPDAPQPDTAMLWSFLSRQLAEGISNEPKFIGKRRVASGDAHDASSAISSAGRAKGVVIPAPEPFSDTGRTVPLPESLRAVATASHVSGADRAPEPAPVRAPPRGPIHVFWDVESAHPGDRDPRLVAAEVMRLARNLGYVAGCYAYANRPAWAWVPSYFVTRYVQAGGEGDDAGGAAGAPAPAAAAAAVAAASSRRLRCPLCGQAVAASRLERHLQELHPDRPAATLAAAALAEGRSRLLQAATAAAEPGPGRPPRPAGAAAAPAAARGSPKNTYRTGLGSVREYVSSEGVSYRPTAGHQLGLKYVVQREGFEPRVVQSTDGASDRAVNGGVDRLMAALRAGQARAALRAGQAGWGVVGAGESGGEEEAGPPTLLLVSGSRRHGAALSGCRRLGVRTVVVAAGGVDVGAAGEADVWLDWEVLAGGAYQLLT